MNKKVFPYQRDFFTAVTVVCLLAVQPLLGQKPNIKTIDKPAAGTAEILTIKGENFGSDASQLSVHFGAAKATIESIENQSIEVRVPPGATYDEVSVANTAAGRIGYSREKFLLSFGGSHPFDVNRLQGQTNFATENGLYDLCLCDLDGDNKNDVVTANDNSNYFSVLTNTSVPGTPTFTTTPRLLNTRSIHITCGDINGDGKPDIVASEGGDGDRIFIYLNGSNTASETIKLTGRKTKRVEIADLDLDGRPEIIVTDQGSNIITVLLNQGNLSTLSFTPQNLTVTGAASTDGLAVADLNGDYLPEIITGQFLAPTSNVFILQNRSVPGTLNLGNIVTLPAGTIVNIKVGDLDGDRKPEIVATQLLSSAISLFPNQSTSSAVSFGAPRTILTEERPWGLDLGDLDGDGKTDIVVASISKKALTILNNESTSGNFTFVRQIKSTSFITRHLAIGDVDGDGKHDIVFTSIEDANDPSDDGLTPRVSVFRNSTCMIPKLTPEGPLSVCTGFPLELQSSVSRGAVYTWRKDGVVIPAEVDPVLDVSASGKYTVTAIVAADGCSEVSNEVDVTVSNGTFSGTPNPINNGPICLGSALELKMNDLGAGITYQWSGPAGYTGTGLEPPPINNFQAENAGRYYVDIVVGTCVAAKASTFVEIIDAPEFLINSGGSNVICQGDSKTLTIMPASGAFTYQWYEKTTGLIPGADNSTHTVSASGEYYATASFAGCTTIETPPVKITVASLPTAAFEAPASACTGQLIQFTNQSATDPNVDPVFAWTFGDGNTSADRHPAHTYTSGSNFTVKLRVTYDGGVCPHEITKPINVQASPLATITNPQNKYIFCPGDSILLQVAGSYNSYEWSTSETTPIIYAKEAGTYTVEVTTASCTLNASKVVQTYEEPDVIVSKTPERLQEGQSAQLSASGLLSYEWSPAETLSDAAVPDPVATPLVTTVYTVTGLDANGCRGKATIEVGVIGDAIVNKLEPRAFFSPDGRDEINAYWKVTRIEEYPQCSIAIYDEKGIKVFEAKPYLNDWNGTFNGKLLPDGVYYYIIRCDGEESKPKSGSITLLR